MPILPTGKDCCGCSACESACKFDALSLKLDSEGFHFPSINEKCVECKCCEVACPNLPFLDVEVKKKSSFKATNELQNVYAIKAKDEKLVLSSSSGGVFSLLAKNVLKDGGVVFGAAFDDEFEVKHIAVTSEDELVRLKTSKYVESFLGRTFEEVANALKAGKKVLFSGTQCQVMGLNSFLKKPHANLLTAEVICNSVPSVKVWRVYKDELEKRVGKLKEFSFRDKSAGWQSGSFRAVGEKGELVTAQNNDCFMRGFLQHKITRESCGSCKAKNGASGADITLGDFWKINYLHRSFADKKGVSLILTHTKKGEEAVLALGDSVSVKKSGTFQAKVSNPALLGFGKLDKNRSQIIKETVESSSTKTLKESTNSVDVGIVTFTHTKDNYGQVLQLYALQSYIRENYPNLVVRNYEYKDVKKRVGKLGLINKFAFKFLKRRFSFDIFSFDLTSLKGFVKLVISKFKGIFDANLRVAGKNSAIREAKFDKFRTQINFERENLSASKFIVGSDQVWNVYKGGNLKLYKKQLDYYTLTFARKFNPHAKLFSYAASFGRKEFSPQLNAFFQPRLAKFDAISIREYVNLTDLERWGVSGEVVPDPTLLIGGEKWAKTGQEFGTKDKAFCYILISQTAVTWEQIFEKMKTESVRVYANMSFGKFALQYGKDSQQPGIEEFVGAIRDSKFVVTNSFHGVVFCILLNRPFFFLGLSGKSAQMSGRTETLLKVVGLEHLVVNKLEDFDEDKFLSINWTDVNEKVALYREKGEEFLRKILAM